MGGVQVLILKSKGGYGLDKGLEGSAGYYVVDTQAGLSF
jgi:hypothetical protein